MRKKKNKQLSGFYYIISEKFTYAYFLKITAFDVHFLHINYAKYTVMHIFLLKHW